MDVDNTTGNAIAITTTNADKMDVGSADKGVGNGKLFVVNTSTTTFEKYPFPV